MSKGNHPSYKSLSDKVTTRHERRQDNRQARGANGPPAATRTRNGTWGRPSLIADLLKGRQGHQPNG